MAKANQSENAYQQIRQRLIAGTIEAGARLVEQTWAKALNVNRGDIRQALARLLAEGAVSKGKRGGFFARIYSDHDIKEITETRLILEIAAVNLAVLRATEQDLDEMDQLCRHMKIMADNGYLMGFCETDVRFHHKLVQIAHNASLLKLYEHANIPLSNFKPASNENRGTKLITDAEDHQNIVNALRNQKPDLAANLLKQGLERIRQPQNITPA